MKKILKNKKAFQMSFGMLFSIIAGAVILFLAIYAASKFIIPSGKNVEYSQAAKEISNYLNPIYSGTASAYLTKINFKKETRIYLSCDKTSKNSPYFGKQTIAFSEESGLGKKWAEPGAEISRYNKYIFSENISQGKNYYLFAKPFFSGFRVDDLILASMNKYCFILPPDEIREELEGLGASNINISDNIRQCSKDSFKVCFNLGLAECNISVFGDCNGRNCESEYTTGYINKDETVIYYTGNLIYAGIFSSPEIYECNVKRLGKKIAELSRVYLNKIKIVANVNCNSAIKEELDELIAIGENIKTSREIIDISEISKIMDEKNEVAACKIY